MSEGPEDEPDIGEALSGPTGECRRILNVWTSKCVFSDGTD